MFPKRMFPCALAMCSLLGLLATATNAQTVDNSIRPVITTTTTTTTEPGGRRRLETDPVIISLATDELPAPERTVTMVTGMGASAHTPSIWPVTGIMWGGFGVRRNPFGGMSSEFHKGQDISAPFGTPVSATADGVVVVAGWQRGYGRVVYVDHGNGISTRYGHLSRLDVAVGQMIKRGALLGLVGSSGRSTGPHLHYEVRINGEPTNPLYYLPNIATASNPLKNSLN